MMSCSDAEDTNLLSPASVQEESEEAWHQQTWLVHDPLAWLHHQWLVQ